MNSKPNVAVVRDRRRRAAVAQALALVADDVREKIAPIVVLKPNFVSHQRQLPSTHVDAFSATLDALFAAGAREVVVAEGADDANAAFDRFGLRQEARGRPVRFFDINREETEWIPLELVGADGSTVRSARVSRTIAEAGCRVSLALAKTHVTTGLTFSLKNMLSGIHKSDRVMMHGSSGGGNGYAGWRKIVVDFLKGDNLAVNLATRTLGRLRNASAAFNGKQSENGWNRLTERDKGYLRSVTSMHQNLVALSRIIKPHISIIDAHEAMHGEGPRHGTPIRLDVAIAGTDAVAVDATAARLLGFNPSSIGYLTLAERERLGIAASEEIAIVGDAIETVSKKCRPHSNHHVQRHWERVLVSNPAVAPAPGTSHRRDALLARRPNLDPRDLRHESKRT